MARLRAFRGTRYSLGLVDPQEVVAPPYDVVGPDERARLAASSPYNSILVELPEAPPGYAGDRYGWAATLWQEWHGSGVVRVDPEPALYLYRMTFTEEDGRTRSTTGVLGALGLDPDGAGEVLAHEQTTAKDTTDRLSLLRAARTNFSPIWGLSLASGLGALCSRIVDKGGLEPLARVRDGADALHECWAITDTSVTRAITDLVASTPVLIADGHHRYETACTYHEESAGSPGSDDVLALVVELSERELAVQAIHRLLGGLEAPAILRRLEASFEIGPGPAEPLELGRAMAASGALGLLTPADGSWLLVPRPSRLADGDDELDSVRLARALDRLPEVTVTYQHGVLEAARAVREHEAEAAVLLRPVAIDQIASVAHGGRRMPPKSTFFYPKPRTGLVFRELDAG